MRNPAAARPAPRTVCRPFGPASALLALAFALAGPPAGAQQPQITPNYREADIRELIDAVSQVTGRNFLVDPRVRAQVTLISQTPMSPDAF